MARSTNEVWRRGKTVMIPLYFRLCYVFSCRERVKRVVGITVYSYVRTQTKAYVLT